MRFMIPQSDIVNSKMNFRLFQYLVERYASDMHQSKGGWMTYVECDCFDFDKFVKEPPEVTVTQEGKMIVALADLSDYFLEDDQ